MFEEHLEECFLDDEDILEYIKEFDNDKDSNFLFIDYLNKEEFLNSFIVSDINGDDLKYCDLNDEKVQVVLNTGNTTNYFKTRQYLTDKLLTNIIKNPIYQIEFKDRIPALTSNVVNLKHNGEMTDHDAISKLVVNEINKSKKQVRP